MTQTRRVFVDTTDQSVTAATAWWNELTAAGGDSMIVKPAANLVHGRTELLNHITHPDTKQGVEQLYSQVEVTAEDIAEVIAFVVGRSLRLAIHEVLLLRPAGQDA